MVQSDNNNNSVFGNTRQKKDISQRKLSEITGISRRIIKEVDEGNFQNARFEDIIKIAKHLEINLSKFIRDKYGHTSGEIYEEEMDTIVNRLIEIQMDLIFEELSSFASSTETRVDDFDIKKIISRKSNLHRLIILNNQLKNKNINKREALSQFPPVKGPFDRRRRNS